MSENPFHSPSVLETTPKPTADSSLDGAVEVLMGTRPWVRFISVLMFLGALLLALSGLGAMLASRGNLGLSYLAIAVNFLISLMYIVPAIFLWVFANRISLFEFERTGASLTSALRPQRWFWTYLGVVAIVALIFYAGVFVFAMVAISRL